MRHTLEPGAGRAAQALVAGFGLFCAGYFALFRMGAPAWLTDAALLIPPGATLVLSLRRARKSSGRAAAFWSLIVAGLGLWLAGGAGWALAELLGYTPRDGARPLPRAATLLYEWLLLGFLLPMVGAVALRLRPRGGRRDALGWVDATLLAGAISFVFVRLVFLPILEGGALRGRVVQGLLSFLVATWSALLWRSAAEHPEWRHAFGHLALFAIAYGTLDSLAGGLDHQVRPAGGVADLAWIVPFLFLAFATLPARAGRRPLASSPMVVLLAGAGPPALDAALRVLLPPLGMAYAPRPVLLVATSALMALGCALRLRLEDRAEERRMRDGRARAEESRRGVRLQTLAAMSATAMEDLGQAARDLVRRAEEAAGELEEKGERALEQAQRAQGIVREMSAAFRLSSRPPHQEVDLAAALEAAVQSALDEGVALHVRLEGTARLPRVSGDRVALETSFLHLIRNAAQASPGGVLGIVAEADERQVALRFEDDGPGVPPDIRSRIFDPFFTTRRVGEGLGLGLTLVHFTARDHGGSIVLEPSSSGACFVLRLPARPPRHAEGEGRWPMPAAVLAAAAAATVLAVLPAASNHLMAATAVLQVGSALAAAAALLYAAARSAGAVRVFWAVLAGAPGLWAAVRVVRMLEGAPRENATDSVWHFIGYALADLIWAAALLIRPDRVEAWRSSRAGFLTRITAFGLFAHAYVYLVVLPAPFAEVDGPLADQTAMLRGLARLALASWAFLLSWRTLSPDWQGAYGRLGLCLAAAALGQSVAGMARIQPGYYAGAITDLGWIVPGLLLAAVAMGEGRRRPEPLPATADADESSWDAAVLLGLLILPALEVLTGPSIHPQLYAMRHTATLLTLAVVGVMLGVREVVRPRERWFRPVAAPAPGPGPGSTTRLLRLVGTALFELSGHLSGVAALARLLLSQSDASHRVRADAARIRERADSAARIARNLIAALAGEGATPELASINRLAEEVLAQRRADLAQESIRLESQLAPSVPLTWLQTAALRQVILSVVDNAAVAIRTTGKPGLIEIATALEGDHVVVRVRDDGPGLPKAALRLLAETAGDRRATADLGLTLGQEIVAQHGGTLTGRNRARGGAEITLRLPVVSAAALRDRFGAAIAGS